MFFWYWLTWVDLDKGLLNRLFLFVVAVSDDTVVSTESSAVKCCEILVSNIPATDTIVMLTLVFQSKRVTGVANCSVESVTYDANDSTCAVVKFSTPEGSLHAVVSDTIIASIYIFINYYLCQGGYVVVVVCLFVCLLATAQKLPNGFSRNFQGRLAMGHSVVTETCVFDK